MQLAEFDRDFFESLDGKGNVVICRGGFYYTILIKGQKAGIVGFLPSRINIGEGFVQVIIAPEFRGKSYVRIAEDLIVEKHKLKRLYATIKIDNLASINAHKKAGYKLLSEEELMKLRNFDLLNQDEIRLVKGY